MHATSPERGLEAAVRHAEALCAREGIVLTRLRRQILAILGNAGRPMGAYAIMDELARARGKGVGPPTVYRTLEFFVAIGCVVKIESRNSFTLCDAPGHSHHGMMLICTRCGKADEVDSPGLDNLLVETVSSAGFHLERQVVEIEGVCKQCWAAADAGRHLQTGTGGQIG